MNLLSAINVYASRADSDSVVSDVILRKHIFRNHDGGSCLFHKEVFTIYKYKCEPK